MSQTRIAAPSSARRSSGGQVSASPAQAAAGQNSSSQNSADQAPADHNSGQQITTDPDSGGQPPPQNQPQAQQLQDEIDAVENRNTPVISTGRFSHGTRGRSVIRSSHHQRQPPRNSVRCFQPRAIRPGGARRISVQRHSRWRIGLMGARSKHRARRESGFYNPLCQSSCSLS